MDGELTEKMKEEAAKSMEIFPNRFQALVELETDKQNEVITGTNTEIASINGKNLADDLDGGLSPKSGG